MNDRNEQMLSMRQLAVRWSLHKRTIQRMIAAGKLACYRLQSPTGKSTIMRIRMADIVDYEENK
jgi:excisionase family DNA binding protein